MTESQKRRRSARPARTSSTKAPSRLARFRRWAVSLFPSRKEWKAALPALGLAILAALLLRLAYRPVHWSPIALVALLPLFWGLRGCRPKMAFWVGLLFGAINGYTFTGWLTVLERFNPMVYLGIVPLALWLGVHIAVACALIVYFGRRLNPWLALPVAMLVWAGMEYFKMIGRLGLPYGLLGHSMGGWESLRQVAAIGGVPLISALIVGVNLCLMETVAAFKARYGQAEAIVRLAIMVILVIGGHFWGSAAASSIRARYADEELSFPIRVAMVQTGIDQQDKYDSYAHPLYERRRILQDRIFADVLAQLGELEPGEYDLIVTPESSLTHDFVDAEEEMQRRILGGVPMLELMQIATDLNAPIITGGTDYRYRTVDGEPTYYLAEGIDPASPEGRLNPGYDVYSGLWILRPGDDTVQLASDYRKRQLMPFGEDVPYFDMIPKFQEKIVQVGTFTRGRLGAPPSILVDQGIGQAPEEVRLGLSICFEDLFPYIHRHHVRHGAQLFVNTTNDAWFDGSPGPAWHMDMARWRTIEMHLPMVRTTNSGITALVDPLGNLVAQLDPMTRDILVTEVRVLRERPRTLYSRLGDWPGRLGMLVTIPLFIYLRRREKIVGASEA